VSRSLLVRNRTVRRGLVSVASIVVGIALWQLAIEAFHPNPLAIVAPLDVARDARHLFAAGELWPDIRLSLYQLLIGMVVAIAAGTAVGVLLGASRWLAGAVGPWITGLYTIPVIAVAPLVIVGLGIGNEAKISIVAASAFFPIAINAQTGAAQLTAGPLRDVSRSLRATWTETLRFLVLPGTAPYILTGIRLAIGRALIALVAADLFGSTKGIGYLILSGQQNLDTADVYVGVVTLSVIGLVLTGLVAAVERRMNANRTGGRSIA
jgi:ABC-type nitrate/sulfonate/bicarbonate transport system permease component